MIIQKVVKQKKFLSNLCNRLGVIIFILLFSCNEKVNTQLNESESIDANGEMEPIVKNEAIDYDTVFTENIEYIADGFDFPVGKPNASGYYNAQKFQENNHLGDDWNGVGGGNTDLGDPIYAIANGYVTEAKNYGGGWGNIIRIVHFYDNKLYESLYAHCDTILIEQDQFIKKGTLIGKIGDCNGAYLAHLHFEIRDSINLGIGGGYSTDTTGYLDPTEFIKNNR